MSERVTHAGADQAADGLIRLAVHGASGRMGQMVLQELAQDQRFRLSAALVREHSPWCGQPVGQSVGQTLSYSSAWPRELDLIVDFSLPEALPEVLEAARSTGAALVSGTTGLTPQQQQDLDRFGAHGRLLWASNFSLGAGVLGELARQARRLLPASFEAALLELHHSRKVDAPSGTALTLADALAAVDGTVPAIAAVRAGRIIGEHTVLFAGPYESIELCHRAEDRRVFAFGALAAGAWLVKQAAGRYQVRDWLFGGERGRAS